MNAESDFLEKYPEALFLDPKNQSEIQSLLKKKDILSDNEKIIFLSKAGEGNMNCVLRATTSSRSIILKQSRPWVEKYPQIAAPIDRINIEAEYIKITNSSNDIRKFSPEIIAHLPQHFLLIMSDLGESSDFSDLYSGRKVTKKELDIFAEYLYALHDLCIEDYPSNMEMRILNHEHIFSLPFQKNNGLELDSVQKGLREVANREIQNQKAVERITSMGKIYLSEDFNTLIHGDFYPGSFLDTNEGIKVIDAEFSFVGPVEFDWGVLLAHLVMADQNEDILAYFKSINDQQKIDQKLAFGFAGVEILRRLLGVAQLPLNATISQKKVWVDKALKWILNF